MLLDGTLSLQAIVTGATDGIGRAYCNALAKQGEAPELYLLATAAISSLQPLSFNAHCTGINILLVSRTESKLQTAAAEIGTNFKVQTSIVSLGAQAVAHATACILLVPVDCHKFSCLRCSPLSHMPAPDPRLLQQASWLPCPACKRETDSCRPMLAAQSLFCCCRCPSTLAAPARRTGHALKTKSRPLR